MSLVQCLFFGVVVVFSVILGVVLINAKKESLNSRSLKGVMISLHAFFVLSIALGLVCLFASPSQANEAAAAAAGSSDLGESIRKGMGYIGMGIATGLAAIGAGFGAGIAGAASIGAISEKPALLAKTLIYVGLAEGAAVYGILISFVIFGKL